MTRSIGKVICNDKPVSKPKVLIIGDVNTDNEDFESFSMNFNYTFYGLTTKKNFIKDIQTIHNDVHAIWCMYYGFLPIGGLTKDIVQYLPSSLKIIVTSAVGFDPFDISALGSRGIIVCNSPGLAASPVSDHALYLTLGLYRYSPVFEHILRKVKNTGDCRALLQSGIPWNNDTGRPVLCRDPAQACDSDNTDVPTKPVFGFGEKVGNRYVRQPRGHKVGIAGFGAIGKEIGFKLHSVGMEVHYTKRTPLSPQEIKNLGYPVTYQKSFEDLLPESDLLVLALPMCSATKHIVNDRTLKMLPEGARIVNIGRGGLIDTSALLQALKSGRLAGAALDVFEDEPSIDDDLCSRWDVILTPHIGSSTHENVLGAEKICMGNIFNLFYGNGNALSIVNEEYLNPELTNSY